MKDFSHPGEGHLDTDLNRVVESTAAACRNEWKYVATLELDHFFTTKPVGQGTGQGLSLAHSSIVGRHDGTIGVESTPGVATTFVIGLPEQPVDGATGRRTR